jgi:hypothetical protein
MVRPTPYQGLFRRLDECIEEANAAGLHSFAAIMQMAKLDLQTHAYNITEDELEVFLSAIERNAGRTELKCSRSMRIRTTRRNPPRSANVRSLLTTPQSSAPSR